MDSFSSKPSGRTTNPTDEKIASLIRNYIATNTKEDIFEFMLLASGNIDTALAAGCRAAEGISEIINKTWESKFEQTFQKAKISFGEDVDFRKIQEAGRFKKLIIKRSRRSRTQDQALASGGGNDDGLF